MSDYDDYRRAHEATIYQYEGPEADAAGRAEGSLWAEMNEAVAFEHERAETALAEVERLRRRWRQTMVQWTDDRCPECGSRCRKGCGCRFHDTAPAEDDCPGNCPAHAAPREGGNE